MEFMVNTDRVFSEILFLSTGFMKGKQRMLDLSIHLFEVGSRHLTILKASSPQSKPAFSESLRRPPFSARHPPE
jgi:hypothetical protein